MASKSLGVLTLDMVTRIHGFTQGLDKAERHLDKRAQSMERKLQKMTAAMGVAIAAAAGVAVVGVNKAIDAADALNDMSAKLGIGVEKLSAWGYAAGQAGTDLESLETGLTKLNRSIAEAMDGNTAQADAFRALGISITDASNATSVMPQIADHFAGIESAATKTKLAMELFGKSGAELIPFLEQGSAGLSAMELRAAALGVTLDKKTAKAAGEFKDRMDDVHAITDAVWKQLAAALLPALNGTVGAFTKGATEGGGLAKVIGWIGTQAEATTKDLAFFVKTGEELAALWETISKPRGGPALEQWKKNQMFRGVKGGSSTRQSGDLAKAGVDAAFDFIAQPLVPKVDTSAIEKYLAGLGGRASKSAGSVRELNKALKEHAELIPEIDRRELEREAATMEWHESLEDLRAQLAGPQAEALLQHTRQMHEVQSAYAAGNMTIADFAQWQEALREQLNRTNAGLKEAADAIANRDTIGLMDDWRDSMRGFFSDVAHGEDAWDAAKKGLDRFADALFDLASKNLVEKLFGSYESKGGGSGGDWLGGLLGAIFGSSGGSTASTSASSGSYLSWIGKGYADGGWAGPHSLFEVNERGFEMATVGGRDYMLTGSQPVHITPNHRLGGSMVVNNTINVPRNTSYETASQVASRAGVATARSMRRNG